MNKLSIFFLFIFSLSAHAQEFSIEWQSPEKVQINQNKSTIIPYFEENSYVDGEGIPHFFWQEKASFSQNLTLTITKTETLSQAGELPIDKIPTSPSFVAKSSKAGKSWSKIIDLIPIYKDKNGVLKKIIRFSLSQKTDKSAVSKTSLTSIGNYAPVLNEGTFYKIAIDTTGVYKIDYNFLRSNGISTDFNPNLFKVYGNGGLMLPEDLNSFRFHGLQENAIYAVGTEDGSFDQGDYFLFYAQGANGYLRDGTNVSHSKNLYADKAYYFINFDRPETGKRISNSAASGSPTQVFSDFDQLLFRDIDQLNVYEAGRQWFENVFNDSSPLSFTFEGTGTISNASLKYRFVGVNAGNDSYAISINGSSVASQNIGSSGDFVQSEAENTFSASYPLNLEISFDNSSNPAGSLYFDYVELSFKQSLSFNNEQMLFRWFEDLTENAVFGVNISGSPEFVWNVSDPTNAKNMSLSGSNYLFESNAYFDNAFVAFNTENAYTPNTPTSIENQDLSSLSSIDYVIVTYPDFIAYANRLAQVHQEVSGVSTAVVTTEQIYNEFSSGGQDLSAIRDFFKFLYDQASPLKYALLLGDASYDYKDRISNNTNFVPAYESYTSSSFNSSYVTDDFFGILDYSDSSTSLLPGEVDISLGRLPAATNSEASAMINKSIAYLSQLSGQGTAFGDWRTKIDLVVDDDNPGSGNAFHTKMENETAQWLEENYPYLTIKKLYIDAYQQEGTSGGYRYPDVNDAMVNTLETGSLLVNYLGHGGIFGWAQERIFISSDIEKAENFNSQFTRLPLYVTVTCDFSVWDIPQIESAGELLIKNTNGGAFSMITTSRPIGVSFGTNINDEIVKRLFELNGSQYLPIGEALRLAKVDYSRSDGLKINLLGDPLIPLARPQQGIEIESINGQDYSSFDQTLRALDFVSIKGHILDSSGVLDSDFNGTLTGSLFDKPEDKTTLNNDGDLDVLNYEEQVNSIYRGNTSIENGEFTFEFYVPKDINFTVGNGKLLLYAFDDTTDAVTSDNTIKVGDINSEGLDDDEGPGIKLYMNNLNFANGGITDQSPYLLACVTDSTGINSTGSGIGHDITNYLDSDVYTTAVLNEYFEGGEASPCSNPNLKDYQKGRVFYRLRDLELGEHTANFKVWDINNNSSSATLDFVVMEDGENKLYINRLLNWPNPFTTRTFFHFEHNCPTGLEVQVQVFTIAGKLVKNIRQHVSSEPFREGYRTGKFAIPWDGLDDFGNKIGKGVYIYRVIVKGEDSETCKGTATETEKLVILK